MDQVERTVLAERQVAAVLLASGRVKDVEMPTVAAAVAAYDAALVAELHPAQDQQSELRQILGVA